MLRSYRIAVVVSLVLALGHLPLPVVHRHLDLNVHELEEHIHQDHGGVSTPLDDWHLHVLWLGIVDGQSLPDVRRILKSLPCDLVKVSAKWVGFSLSLCRPLHLRPLQGWSHVSRDRAGTLPTRYILFCTFLL